MLHLSNISKEYGLETVLAAVSFVVNAGERVGLIGPNGSGKTTLLQIIAGVDRPDRGRVWFDPPRLAPGYLEQALTFAPGETIDEVLGRATADHCQARTTMQIYAERMANVSGKDRLAALTEAYAEAETRFEAAGGYALEARVEKVLAGLELTGLPRDFPVAHLSGGQKTRLGLATLLIQQPRLLLLDEPTNHLDIDALAWLEAWLREYEGAVLIVSHDRVFLDAVTTRTLVLDPDEHTLRDLAGNYSAYLETLAREQAQQLQDYQAQQKEIAQLGQAAHRLRGQARFRRGGKADSNDKFAKDFFANRSAGTVARAKQLEKRLEQLRTEEKVAKPARRWQLKVDLAGDEGGAREVLRLENVAMRFGAQLLFDQVDLTLRYGQRVALTGPNGTGKTTLLRIITGALKPTAGRVRLGRGIKLGYMAQEQELLDPRATPYETIRAVTRGLDQGAVRRFLHKFLFTGDEVFIKIGDLSFGERTRLMLALLVAQDCNFLVMDEPVNHLDIPSRERFEEALVQFPGSMLAVVHDRMFIDRVATDVWELRSGTISPAFPLPRSSGGGS